MQSIRAHAICCLVLSVVCAGCSAVHKHQPRVREHGGLESATVSGPACAVIRRGSNPPEIKSVEAGQTETLSGSDDSFFQLSVFARKSGKTCGDYKFEAGTLCMKCAGEEDKEYAEKMGIACCV